MIYSNILSAIFGNHWYASAEYMDAVLQVANNIFAGKDFFAQLERQQLQIEQEAAIQGAVVVGRTGTRGNDVQLTTNGTAVVPITGIIAPKASAIGMCMNGTSMDMLAKRANELAVNADVERVVLNINSGGGSVLGVPEAARAIRELAKIKPVTAYFNYIGASAAYFLAAAAGKRVVTDSSITGSIGVYTIVASQSEKLKKEGIDARIIRRGTFKAMPNGVEPFSAQQEGLDRVEADVEKHYRVFVNAIQNYLGISMEQAEKLADGTVTTGLAGIESGLADIEGTLEAVISGEIQADVVGTPSIVVTVPEKVEEIEASLDFVEGAPSEERAEEIAASLPSEDIVEESVDSPAVSNETEIAKLKLQVELLSTQLENTESDI